MSASTQQYPNEFLRQANDPDCVRADKLRSLGFYMHQERLYASALPPHQRESRSTHLHKAEVLEWALRELGGSEIADGWERQNPFRSQPLAAE